MNRLVIIGNGFDLAHGLPTGYCDFMNHRWQSVIASMMAKFTQMEFPYLKYEDELISITVDVLNFDFYVRTSLKEKFENDVNDFQSLNEFILNHALVIKKRAYYEKREESQIKFKNEFFRVLNTANSANNWVDVENEYYGLLKLCLKEKDNEAITEINKEFEVVKGLLKKYLIENVEKEYDFNREKMQEFLNIIENKKYENKSLNQLYKEMSKKEEAAFKRQFKDEQDQINKISKTHQEIREELWVENYFLSFNYTSTVNNYHKISGLSNEYINEIHGNLIDAINPINFGFGDEMDKHYPEIEEKNDNEYLRNIKSFQYLHTPNYKRLLDLIDSDKFQVYIMGHSCGLSDRTLLNTIFEHENCISIKVFYHKQEDGTDNYTEITQNISRHFNKKKLMREKIVNKTLCEPMPQINLSLKEKTT